MADIKLNIGNDASIKPLLTDLSKALDYANRIKTSLGDTVILKDPAKMAKQINDLEKLRGAIEKKNKAEQEELGILGALERKTKDLRSAMKSATSVDDIKKINKELQITHGKMKEAKGSTDSWGKALGSFQFKFNALGNIAGNVAAKLGTVAASFISFNKIVGSADSSQDSWNRTLQTTNNVLAVFNKSLATGDFSGFIDNLKASIEYGGKFADIMDDIEDRTRELSVAEARQENVITELRIAQKDATKTTLEQIDAGKQIIIEEEKLAELRKGIAKDALDAEAQNIANLTGLKKEDVIATVEQFSSMKNLINLGKTYNERAINEEAIRQMSINGIENFTEAQQKQYDELIAKRNLVKNYDLDALKSAEKYYLGTKKLSDAEREVISKRLIEDYNARNSANQRTLKIQTALNADIEALNTERLKLDQEYEDGYLKILEQEREEEQKKYDDDIEAAKKKNEEKLKLEQEYSDGYLQILEEERKDAQDGYDTDIKNINEIKLGNIKDQFARAYELLEQQKQEEIALARRTGASIDLIEQKYAQKKKDIDAEVFQARITNIDKYLQTTSSALNTISSLFEASKQRELSAVGDNEKKREEIETKYRKKQQAMSIAQAIINGALSITNLLANVPGSVINPATWVAMAISAASTAAQVGIIATQKFAEGGEVGGRPHSQGGTNIEAEKGEYVIRKDSVSKYKDLIEAINDDDKNKIFNALNMELNGKQFKIPQARNKTDYNKKLYDLLAGQEVYGETNDYYVIQKGSSKILIPKTK